MPVLEVESAMPGATMWAEMRLLAEPREATIWPRVARCEEAAMAEFTHAWLSELRFPHELLPTENGLVGQLRRVYVMPYSHKPCDIHLQFAGNWTLAEAGGVIKAFKVAMEDKLGVPAHYAAYKAAQQRLDDACEAWEVEHPNTGWPTINQDALQPLRSARDAASQPPPGMGHVQGKMVVVLA